MNRIKWLVGVTVVLVAVRIALSVYSGWGLITVHADKAPLQQVIQRIASQGHISLHTDLDPPRP